MSWIIWIILGLVAGILAKWIMPGRDPGGFIVTIILGIVGALIGGFISVQLGFGVVTGFDIKSIIIAGLGAMLLLFLYRMVKSRS